MKETNASNKRYFHIHKGSTPKSHTRMIGFPVCNTCAHEFTEAKSYNHNEGERWVTECPVCHAQLEMKVRFVPEFIVRNYVEPLNGYPQLFEVDD